MFNADGCDGYGLRLHMYSREWAVNRDGTVSAKLNDYGVQLLVHDHGGDIACLTIDHANATRLRDYLNGVLA